MLKQQRPTKRRANMKSKLLWIYFAFSGWIANLGVVPLLLFAAFLFLPILVFLAFLLFLVTLVFETITQLLSTNTFSRCRYSQSNKSHNLRPYHPLVKGLLATLFIFYTLLPRPALAFSEKQLFSSSITLSIGQLHKIPVQGVIKYSLGNKEIASIKALEEDGSLLLKGKGLGHTDLFIWLKGRKKPLKKQIFVVHKSRYIKLKALALGLSKTGLKRVVSGNHLQVSGVIKNKEDYLLLVKTFLEEEKYLDLSNTRLSPHLKLTLYGELLEVLSEHDLLDVNCQMKALFLHCKGSKAIKEALKDLSHSYLIRWTSEELFTIGQQYRVTLTLQQFESSKADAFNFGLSQIDGNLGQILFENPLSLIEKNSILLKDTEFKTQTLAHPKLTGRLNHPIKVRLGQEIPFLQSVTNGVATQQWRFAGLAIDILLKPHTDRVLVEFKTNLSQPGERGISQNLQESSVLSTLNENQVLFDIGFNIKQKGRERMPFLSKIPLFGSLFQGRSKGETYKKILCLIHVEKVL